MVKHIVMFRFFDEISTEERQVKAQEIKEKTEALKEQIAGIGQLQVFIAPVGTSTHSFMLEGLFDSVEALDCYQVHPAHLAVGTIIKSVAGERAWFDYEV